MNAVSHQRGQDTQSNLAKILDSGILVGSASFYLIAQLSLQPLYHFEDRSRKAPK